MITSLMILVSPILWYCRNSRSEVSGKDNIIKKGTLAQEFSCRFCGISNNTFFKKTTLVAASDIVQNRNDEMNE